MKKELFVPFDANGNLLDYVYTPMSEKEEAICRENGEFTRFQRDGRVETVFVPNFTLYDTLRFTGFSRGRSSVKAHFESQHDGKKYEMFISDLEDVIKEGRICNGYINGHLTFVKKGQNYGIKLLE